MIFCIGTRTVEIPGLPGMTFVTILEGKFLPRRFRAQLLQEIQGCNGRMSPFTIMPQPAY